MKSHNLKSWFTKILLFFSLSVLAISFSFVSKYCYEFIKDIKTSEVKLEANLTYLKPEKINKIVKNYLGTGFYQIDLDKLKFDLEKLSWVETANLSRKWPSTLIVEIEEKQPLAVVNNSSLLSVNGEIFFPDSDFYNNSLPIFYSKEEFIDELTQKFHQISKSIKPLNLQIKELELMSDGGLRTLLDRNINLYLGSYELTERLENFTTAYRYKLNKDIGKIAYIDLRYTNGIAVGWKMPKRK